MKTKINNKSVVFAKGGNVLCNDCKLSVSELAAIIRSYIICMKSLERISKISINQTKMNYGIRFSLFGINCTVGKLFELYNEVAQIEDLPVYSKIWYNPEISGKINS